MIGNSKIWSINQLFLVSTLSQKKCKVLFWRLFLPLTSSLAAVVANQLKLFKTAGSWAL